MFIIRTAFWLSVVVLLLPIGGENQQSPSGEPVEQTNLSAGDAINAAIATVGDVAGLCQREPEVCDAGSAVWQTFQMKARYGAEMLYRWANGDDDVENQASVRQDNTRRYANQQAAPFLVSENTSPVYTGSTIKRTANNNGSRSQNTLKIEDLIPEWKGPPKQTRA